MVYLQFKALKSLLFMVISPIISPIVTLFLSRLLVSHSSSFPLSQRTSSPRYPQGGRASGNIPPHVSSHTLLPFLHRLCGFY